MIRALSIVLPTVFLVWVCLLVLIQLSVVSYQRGRLDGFRSCYGNPPRFAPGERSGGSGTPPLPEFNPPPTRELARGNSQP